MGAAYIKSAKGNEWLPVEDATYVYSKDYWTPMNYGVLAFPSKVAAEQYMEENGEDEVYSFEQLDDFQWGIHF
ncbi:nitrous oxide reductase accessory protein NosL [Ureibacillus sp. FSL K6-2830]|uniref:nitrous oxide reductase accessory protein NosL n=1 Tax=Ureibacillus sp. FSL K6-2830 TaxID=2954610 RepID=UPI0030FCF0CD